MKAKPTIPVVLISEKEAIAMLPFGRAAFRARVDAGHIKPRGFGGKLKRFDQAEIEAYRARGEKGEVKL